MLTHPSKQVSGLDETTSPRTSQLYSQSSHFTAFTMNLFVYKRAATMAVVAITLAGAPKPAGLEEKWRVIETLLSGRALKCFGIFPEPVKRQGEKIRIGLDARGSLSLSEA